MSGTEEVDAKAELSATVLEQAPFPIKTSGGRKYLRIELSSPVKLRLLRCVKGRIKLSSNQTPGTILNLSEKGVLLVCDSPVPEEGFLLLTLNLNKLVVLEGVLGKIKRVEPSDEGDFLVGIEFVCREELEKLTSAKEIERLPVKVAGFDKKLGKIISSFLRTAKLTI